MRVIINRFLTLGQKTGIGHYTAELLRCLEQQASPGEISCFPSGWTWRLGRALSRPILARGEKSSGPKETQAAHSIWPRLRQKTLFTLRRLGQAYLARSLKKCLARQAFDLYHEPNTIPLSCDRPTLATLHDLSVLLYPEWHPAGRVAHFEKNLLPSLSRCVHFLAVSEFTRQEAIRTLNLAPERITRVYNGIRPDLLPLAPERTARRLRRLGLPGQYLLYVGTIEPRKNVLLLLQAYCALPETLRTRFPLVLVGGWGWSSAQVAEFFHNQAKHRGVIHLGYVADKYLPALYNGARALIYPSLYEGFGLPPLEMMACGGAVLASTAGALVETAGARAQLIDPHDVDGWRDAMARVITDADWWQSLRAGTVALALPFTWDRCAKETLSVYRSLCGQAVDQPLAA